MNGKIKKQELSPDLSDEIGISSQQIIADDPVEVSFVPGTQIVNAPRKSRVSNIGMDGRTLVNIPGRDGNCESLAPFSLVGTVPTLSTTLLRSGTSSFKYTLSASSGYFQNDYAYTLASTKYYVFAAWVYVESWSNGTFDVSIRGFGSVNPRYGTLVNTAKVGEWQLVWVKIPAGHTIPTTGFRILIGATVANTAVYYIDEIRLYELSAADSDAIGTTYTTDEEIDSFIPYVDDMKHVNAVWMRNPGKNLLPLFSEWTLHANAVVTSSYELIQNAVAGNERNTVYLNASKNQTYTLSQPAISSDAFLLAFTVSTDGTETFVGQTFGVSSISFTTDTSTERIKIQTHTQKAGTFTFSNPMLNIGSTALPFEPQKESHLYLWDMGLGSNVDGSVADRLYMDENGKPRVTRRFWNGVLDGSLPWSFNFDYSGSKQVYTTGVSGHRHKQTNQSVLDDFVGIKYDGKILKNSSDTANSDEVGLYSADSVNYRAYITIADTDSGWGQSYTPDAAKIKAYFNGWKITWAGDGSSPYDGTGSFIYKSIVDGTALPTDQMPTGLASGFTPYRLQYELSQSIDEAVSHEGELMLHDGDNQVSIGTGIVVRETANPYYAAVAGTYYIGNIELPSSKIDYRAAKIFQVYHDDEPDNRWNINSNNAAGDKRAVILKSNFDEEAAYSITYEALDKYLIGIAPQTITGEVVPNIKEAVDDLTRGLVEAKMQISVLANVKSDKQQPGWIVPTLLNGWVNYGSSYAPLSYLKDELGFVVIRGTVKGGSTSLNVTLFQLPVSYRPSINYSFASSISGYGVGDVIIQTDGRVLLNNANATATGVNVRFRAEQ